MNDSDRLLQNSRREAGLVLLLWFVTLVWTIVVSNALGYQRPEPHVRVVLGMPLWVALGVILPWIASTIATIVFCTCVMKDDDLGREQEAGDV